MFLASSKFIFGRFVSADGVYPIVCGPPKKPKPETFWGHTHFSLVLVGEWPCLVKCIWLRLVFGVREPKDRTLHI